MLYELWSINLLNRKSWCNALRSSSWDQCCNEASKIFVLRRFLAEDPSSSSSSAHFQKSKNLRSFEDFRPKIPKIFEKKSSFVEEILRENGRKWVYFLDRKWEKFLMSKIFIVVNFIRIFFHKTYFLNCPFSFLSLPTHNKTIIDLNTKECNKQILIILITFL